MVEGLGGPSSKKSKPAPVSNDDVLKALLAIVNLPPETTAALSSQGVQNKEFRDNLIKTLADAHFNGSYLPAQQLVDHAFSVAKWQPDPSKGQIQNLQSWLKTAGVSDDQLNTISKNAQTAGGGAFSEQNFFQATADVLGADNPLISHGFQSAGIAYTPKAAPPGAAPPGAAPTGQPSDVPPGQGHALGSGLWARPPGGPAAPSQPIPAKKTTDTAAGAPGSTTAAPQIVPTDWAGKAIPKTPQELQDYIRQNYGFAAMALDIPEINKILDDAAKKGLGPDAVKGLISNTAWWQHHDDAERQWLDLEKNDPATARRKINEATGNLQNIVAKSGENVDPRRLAQIAEMSLRHGWSTGETGSALASEYKYDATGQITGISADLKSQARNYLVPMSDASFTQWGQQILAGTATMDGFKNYLSTQAKSLLPGMAGQIDQGFDVKTLIDPYVQRAARLLDIDPNQIDFTDSKWIRFLNQTDPKTGQKVPISIADMESTIKSDPIYGWDKTKGAHEEAAQMSQSILTKFGMG
jgi:hypothetical protein